jgi:hypothetical protein
LNQEFAAMAAPGTPAPMWKRVLAPILDFSMVFFVGGQLIGMATGMTTPGGFNLEGWPAGLLFVLIIAYFYVGRKVAGGTLWDRFFGIARPQPSP